MQNLQNVQSLSKFFATSTAFSPNNVSGITLWLDANDITGLSDADPVGTWSDKSGNGYDAVSLSDNRPLYKTNILNSKPVVRFDGIDDYLETSSFSQASPYTLFLVSRFQNDPGAQRCVLDALTFYEGALLWSNALTTYFFHNPNESYESGAFASTTWYIQTLVVNTTSSVWRKNGAALTLDPDNFSATTLDGMTLGANGNRAENSNIDIAEIILYDGAISGANISNIEDYLSTKYNISLG